MSVEKTSIIQNTIYKIETKELCMREGCEIIEEHYNKISNQRVIEELEKIVTTEIHTANHDFVWAVRSELIEDRIVELGRHNLKQD
jgi:hypothetical protein